MIELNRIYNQDCLEGMQAIPAKSVDMILCDLPYGTTACKWDTIIPFEPLWEQYERVIKDNGAIVLFGAEPFSSSLRVSRLSMYKYDWKWVKSQGVNFAQCNHMPMSVYEDIMVFGSFGLSKNAKLQPVYNPQGLVYLNKQKKAKTTTEHRVCSNNKDHIQQYGNYPKQILKFSSERGFHPTQKPVALFEYLIKTYTNAGETVLDNCMGSGTTAIAAINTDRNFIGFEMDKAYHALACERIQKHNEVKQFIPMDLFSQAI